jgi:hypothetical protein
MKKEVAKQESSELAQIGDAHAWGNREVSAKNILVPKVLLMQSLSEAVSDKSIAAVGDMLYSLDDTVIGNYNKPVTFIPFHVEYIWIVKHGGEFHHIDPVTASNENRPWEEVVNGVAVQNVYCINIYAILAEDPSLPVIIPFKSTSLKAGKKVVTQMDFKNRAAGLMSVKTKNDKGTFAVYDVKEERNSTDAEIMAAFKWFQAVNAGAVKADDSDIVKDAPEVDLGKSQF